MNLFADEIKYDKQKNSTAQSKSVKEAAGCAAGAGSAYLEINNVRALIHSGGDLWWDLQGKAKYEVPKGSGKTTLFAGGPWIGAIEANGNLKLASMKYRDKGVDFWPGPLISTGEKKGTVSADICLDYDKIFSILKSDVVQFRNWYRATPDVRVAQFPGYQIPTIISNWPAHGPVGGYDTYLAPFFDNNNDGIYNPADGDYPFFDLDNSLPCKTSRALAKSKLYGDQSLWWVFNDNGNKHTESHGNALGLEIRAQAYAYSTNDDLNNTTFYNYTLINRSTNTLYNTYFGIWSDADLGYAFDDYVESDVTRGLGILYNGKSIDGTGQPEAYGVSPPAVVIDFFEGPYQDANGIDDFSNWDNNGVLQCDKGFRINSASGIKEEVGSGDFLNGNINGLNFGDGIVDNERWGLRHFMFYNGGNCSDMCDPWGAYDFYKYLRGLWKDGTKLKFGKTGHNSNAGIPADFLYPAQSDKCNWGTAGIVPPPATTPSMGWCEKGEGNPPSDRRMITSTGPFTLDPGAVNDLTMGVVWARSTSGDPYESVNLAKNADDKIQKLFENCFKSMDGPDAPELNIVALDKKLVFHIFNLPASNNYLEKYNQNDPLIVCPTTNPNCEKSYKFQGYQVFQLANEWVTLSDIHDNTRARLVFQCDIQDAVDKLVNYYWNQNTHSNDAVIEVDGINKGITHSFVLTEDAFATGYKKLINNKKYYYTAIAYAYNDYSHYDLNDPFSLQGQKLPYKASNKGSDGVVKIYGLGNKPVMPHYDYHDVNNTIDFADGVEITQMEGHGNGNNNIDLTESSISEIMTGSPWKAIHPKFKAGHGPISVKVIDPLNVPDDTYILKFDTNAIETLPLKLNPTTFELARWYGLITKAKWFVYNSHHDTVRSDQTIIFDDEKLIPEWGISIRIQQVGFPLTKEQQKIGHVFDPNHPIPTDSSLGEITNNGVIESTMQNSSDTNQWLNFLSDQDGISKFNWIRSGTFEDPENFYSVLSDYGWNYGSPVQTSFWDKDETYEKLIGGGWAPYFLCSKGKDGPAFDTSFIKFTPPIPGSWINLTGGEGIISTTNLNSVDIVFTPDKSKWTRCPVLEMGDDSVLSIDHLRKFTIRRAASLDRNGNPKTTEATAGGTQPTGMSYFPGYAIDVETGERLNMMFGEDTWQVSDHGADMLWNPSSKKEVFGGKHFIYVLGNPVHNVSNLIGYITNPIFVTNTDGTKTYLTNYDEGKFIYNYLSDASAKSIKKRQIMTTCMWVGIPLMNPGYSLLNGNTPPSEIKIRLRVAKPYRRGYRSWAVDNPQNGNFPLYTFNTSGFQKTKFAAALTIFPNPNNGIFGFLYNSQVPEDIDIMIYTISGELIFKKMAIHVTGEFIGQIDLNPNPAGIYFINIVSGTGSIYKKIIKNQ